MTVESSMPVSVYCPGCDYDRSGLSSIDRCPECGLHPNYKPPFWRDGWFHFAWALTVAVVPGLVLLWPALGPFHDVWSPAWMESGVRALYGESPIGCWLIPLLGVGHAVVVLWLAAKRSIRWRGERAAIAFGIMALIDGAAVVFHLGCFMVSRSI